MFVCVLCVRFFLSVLGVEGGGEMVYIVVS